MVLFFSLEQKKILSNFFANMAVLFFGATMVSPSLAGLTSWVLLTKHVIVGILFLLMAIKILER